MGMDIYCLPTNVTKGKSKLIKLFDILLYTYIYIYRERDTLYLNIINTHFHMDSKILFRCKNDNILDMVVFANDWGWYILCFFKVLVQSRTDTQ